MSLPARRDSMPRCREISVQSRGRDRRSSRIGPSGSYVRHRGCARSSVERGDRGRPSTRASRDHGIRSERAATCLCRAGASLAPAAGKVAAASGWLAWAGVAPQGDLASAIVDAAPQEVTHEAFAHHAGPGYRRARRVLAVGIQRQPRRDHTGGRDALAPGRDDVARPVASCECVHRRCDAGSALVAARRPAVPARPGARWLICREASPLSADAAPTPEHGDKSRVPGHGRPAGGCEARIWDGGIE